MPEIEEDDFMNAEFEDEAEGQEPVSEETQEEPEVPAGEEAEPEVVFEEDKDYGKKPWNVDPLTNAEKPVDSQLTQQAQKRIGQLRASLTEAARQRDVHARDNSELQNYAKSLQQQVAELTKQLHTGKLSSLESQADSLEALAKSALKEYADAVNSGDTIKAVEAQERMTDAKTKAALYRREAEVGKTAPVPQIPQSPVQQRVAQQQQQVDTTKRDRWIAKNPWFAMDEDGLPENAESKTAIKAHNAALRSGAAEGSDAYFAQIDNAVKAAHPKLFAGKAAAATVTPSSRVASQQPNAGGKQKFIIKPETVKLAKSMGFTTPEDIKAFAIEQAKSMRQKGAN